MDNKGCRVLEENMCRIGLVWPGHPSLSDQVAAWALLGLVAVNLAGNV